MSKKNSPIKPLVNKLILCPYCITIKHRSKKFKTPYALEYHISTVHKDDLGIVTPAKIEHTNNSDMRTVI